MTDTTTPPDHDKPMTGAERQAAYKRRVRSGDTGEKWLSTTISTDTDTALDQLAKLDGTTRRAALERALLLASAVRLSERLPTPDELAGIVWWNGLSDRDRMRWCQAAGSLAPADARSAFLAEQCQAEV
jgi:hypothetical protein